MNTTSANQAVLEPADTARTSHLLELDPEQFATEFSERPFVIRHHLCDHPLLALPRLIELARQLPENSVEYNAGDLAVNQDPDQTPRTGLSVEETLRQIEGCRSWMVLKNVEQEPQYADLLHACLAEVEAQQHPAGQGIGRREAFIFVSSPGAITPYHMDPELNFLLQIRGTKTMSVYPGTNCSLSTEQELEKFYSGAHRNLTFREEYQEKLQKFLLEPGVGLHVPVTAPHWVEVGEEVSISFSITFETRQTERRSILYRVNHELRTRGWNPTGVGVSRWRDQMKYNLYRVGRRLPFWKTRASSEG